MKRIVAGCFILLLALFVVAGCSTFGGSSAKEDTAKPRSDLPNQAFHGFPDVPVPKELTLVQNKSFIYETQAIRAGVLVLSGNVELQSLDDYFKINMVKNGWKFVNGFKFRGEINANYIKDDKTANIKMSRETFTSEVEIWIGPATPLEKGGSFKGNGPARQPRQMD